MTLRTRILIALGGLIAIILMISSTLRIVATHQHELDALEMRATLLSDAHSSALASPIWEYDQDAGLLALGGALKDPDFISAIVYDDGDRSFVALDNPNNTLSADGALEIKRDVRLRMSGGVFKRIGTIEMRFSTARVDQALQSSIIGAIVELLVTLASLIFSLIVLLRAFTRPLESMTEIMRRRAGGDLSLDVDARYLTRNDEIGAIAQSLAFDQQQRRDEASLLEITSQISSEERLDDFLDRLQVASRMLVDAERVTLFLYDQTEDVLVGHFSEASGKVRVEIIPGQGLAGSCFSSGDVILIEDAHQDERFDSSFDLSSGFRTRSVLVVPLISRREERIGVLQVINRRDGQFFNERDTTRLKSLAAQATVAIENASLLADVVRIKNYNENILRSLRTGVISLDVNEKIQTLNPAAAALLHVPLSAAPAPASDLSASLIERNPWLGLLFEEVRAGDASASAEDVDFVITDDETITTNVAVTPMRDAEENVLGSLLLIEDVSSEKRLRSTMSRYMPPGIIEELLHHDRAMLGGNLQEVSALFSDIRDFTTISEALGPRATVDMLNEYFSEMWDAINNHAGILDQYIGDAILAVFGVPFPAASDAVNAVAAANQMMRQLRRLNAHRRERSHKPIGIGVGINTGDVISGNIGAPRRMTYTVIGDAVNLASRLEGATKRYGVDILVSEFTYRQLNTPEFFREVDTIQVKGKTEPVIVYEALEHRFDEPSDALRRSLDHFAVGLQRYKSREWRLARDAFLCALNDVPSDRLTKIYLERVTQFERSPPADDWRGVAVLTEK